MLGSPAPVTSHSLDGLPSLVFSHTIGLPPVEHGSTPVVNDQVKSAASALPARSLTPLVPPKILALYPVEAVNPLVGVSVAVLAA